MAKKLSVTETQLLREAVESRWGRFCTNHGYVGGRKRSAYGGRRAAAAAKLVERGLAVCVEQRSHSEPLSHGFGSTYWTESAFELTDAGREATAGMTKE